METMLETLQSLFPRAKIDVTEVGADSGASGATEKVGENGRPVLVRVHDDRGHERKYVFRTAKPNAYGNARRSDRTESLLLAYETYPILPSHVPATDWGFILNDGRCVSLRDAGEPYLVTEWVDGEPYARDLRELSDGKAIADRDLERVQALADYLCALHRDRSSCDRGTYLRSLRDVVGGHRGIFGIIDTYEPTDGIAGLLSRLEELSVQWRRRIAAHPDRGRKVHGDFHPFNLLFDDDSKLIVLDAMGGGVGDPSDDVAALAINFLFFCVETPAASTAMRTLWSTFWSSYLAACGDQVLQTVPLYLAWRASVLASHAFYPHLSLNARRVLLTWAVAWLERERFDPEAAWNEFVALRSITAHR